MAGAEENKMVNQTAEKKKKDILKLIYKHLNYIKAEISKI